METDSELASIVENASLTNSLAKKAIQEEIDFRNTTIKHILELQDVLRKESEYNNTENSDSWKEKILDTIKRDEDITTQFTESLKPYQAGVTVPYSVKTHKIKEILTGVKQLMNDHFDNILDANY